MIGTMRIFANKKSILLLFVATAFAIPAARTVAADNSPTVTLSVAGQALLPLVVATNASDETRQATEELKIYLERITGGEFALTTGDGTKGIVIGRPGDFAALPFSLSFTERAEDKEAYLLRSSGDALYVIGATGLGLERGIWDLLYRLGHRHFFPSPAWEIVPHKPDLSIAVDTVERPDYIYRRMFYGQGGWMRQGPSHGPWGRHNRMSQDEPGAFRLRTAHSYASIATAMRLKPWPTGLARANTLAYMLIISMRLRRISRFIQTSSSALPHA